MPAGVELALLHEDAAQRLGLVVHPDVEGGQQSCAVNEVVWERQDAEQQVTGGVRLRADWGRLCRGGRSARGVAFGEDGVQKGVIGEAVLVFGRRRQLAAS